MSYFHEEYCVSSKEMLQQGPKDKPIRNVPNFPFVFRQLMGLTVFLAMAQGLFAQEEEVLDNRRIKYLVLTDSITQIDSLSISPDDFSAKIDSVDIEPEKYMLNWRSAELQWLGKLPTDTIQLIYRVYPVNFSEDIFIRDTTIIIPDDLSNFDPYVYRPDEESTLFQESFSLDKSGSITRGIAFGNRQDLSVNSSLDLQLNGKLNDRISVLASVSDKNIPIQPEGNTQQLQDFDQLYIQLYDDRNTLHAGDFILSHAQGPFLRYQKNAQGLNYNFKNNRFKLESSVAISKGRFAQNRIQGIEGNQGPYRLRGNDGEPFIIILSGSERVFIDGKLLERGQNRDYIINYNTAEISFTARNPITKDKRIQVEFQYSVKSYARSMLQTSVANSNDAWSWYIDAYAEQDAKNQPLQQDLDADDKQALSDAGDILNTAFVNGVDSVAYNADLILYAQIDSLGFSPVYLQTNNPDSANYQVIFTQVGSGNGDYVEGDFTANGKVYVWIAPEFIDGQWVHYGDYAPIRLLTAPEKQQMIAGGVSRRIGEKNSVSLNAAVSNRDLNTFSSIGNSDNVGLAVKGSWDFASKPEKGEVEREKWYFSSGVDAEHVARNFRRVERFRSMEFNRDWNLSNTEGRDLYLYGARFGVNRVENGQAELSVKRLDLEGYTGVRSAFNSDMAVKGLRWIEEASYTSNKEAFSGEFLRHRGHLTWQRGLLKWGYRDEFERNDRTQSGDILSGSYGFYDYETYLSTSDSLKNASNVSWCALSASLMILFLAIFQYLFCFAKRGDVLGVIISLENSRSCN